MCLENFAKGLVRKETMEVVGISVGSLKISDSRNAAKGDRCWNIEQIVT
jgi:hypothetical protein